MRVEGLGSRVSENRGTRLGPCYKDPTIWGLLGLGVPDSGKPPFRAGGRRGLGRLRLSGTRVQGVEALEFAVSGWVLSL